MNKLFINVISALLVFCGTAAAKPLKVYILAGQSNMEGHAAVRVMDHVGTDPKTAPLLKDMKNEDGTPQVCDDVYISYLTGKLDAPTVLEGKLTAGFGAQGREPKIGPEFTFGIYMQKHLNEPILIIKTAWGGKSLNTDFRPPSAGKYEYANPDTPEEKKNKRAEASGVYYRQMIEYVRKVLADPYKVYPDYNKKDGYEVAGFVWFQGWNDMVDSGTYPNRNKKGGYDLYTELMCKFIKDVRKDLKAPDMKFVIGVLGVGGEVTEESEAARQARYRGIAPGIRAAMSAPAEKPEFKGNVAAVHTDKYWDYELDELEKRMNEKVKGAMKAAEKEKKLSREEKKALQEKLEKEAFTEKELNTLKTGKSNAGFHYLGSAKTMAQIGKAFADAMYEMQASK